MKRFFLLSMLVLAVGAAYAQGEVDDSQSKAPKKEAGKYAYKYFFEFGFGAPFWGGVKGGTLQDGTGGTWVRDIEFADKDFMASFMMEARVGMRVLDWLSVAGSLGFNFMGSSVKTGYKESQAYTNGTHTASDKITRGSPFFCIDASAIFTPLPATMPMFVNPGFGIGAAFALEASKTGGAGGLSYDLIMPGSWQSSYSGSFGPSPDYIGRNLADVVEGFYFKPSLDVGVYITSGKKSYRVSLNGQAKIFPALIGKGQEVTINDGIYQRTVTMTMPLWLVPSVTFMIGFSTK